MNYPLFIILYEHSFPGFLFLSIFPCFFLHVNLKQKTIKYSISIVKIRIADPGWIFPDPTFEKKNPDPDPNKFFTNAIYILLFLNVAGFIFLYTSLNRIPDQFSTSKSNYEAKNSGFLLGTKPISFEMSQTLFCKKKKIFLTKKKLFF